MIKSRAKVPFLLVVTIILFLGLLNLSSCRWISSREERAWIDSLEEVGARNTENLKKVEVGMDTSEVFRIMGRPSEGIVGPIIIEGEQPYYLTYYDAPEAAGLTFSISYDTLGKVIRIVPTKDFLNRL